jgi:hypothetical protein
VFGPSRGGVRVLLERGGELVRVQWYDDGIRRVKSWPNTREGRTEAKAWARAFAEARTLGPRPAPRLTLRQLWERYLEAEFPHLRDRYTGPWVFYTPHRQRWNGADDERAAWTAQALWLALTKAERRARVRHLPYRAIHGFRRAIAGDVLELTRDLKLALDWIGDVDLGMARRYLRPRDPRLEEAATAVDRLLGEIGDRNRHATVTDSRASWDVNAEAPGELELAELGRVDSNHQLRISIGEPVLHAA